VARIPRAFIEESGTLVVNNRAAFPSPGSKKCHLAAPDAHPKTANPRAVYGFVARRRNRISRDREHFHEKLMQRHLFIQQEERPRTDRDSSMMPVW
jgi:hypothetical protein